MTRIIQNQISARQSLNNTKHRGKLKISKLWTRKMKNILNVNWKCQVILNSTKRLKDWSNKVFGETIILKSKNLGKWNKIYNKIRMLIKIKFNIIHKRKKERVTTLTEMKTKILKIKIWSTTRTNTQNLKNRANSMIHLITKKQILINLYSNKFQIKTKMKMFKIKNNRQPISQKTHFWMVLNTKMNKSTKTAAINLKETRSN